MWYNRINPTNWLPEGFIILALARLVCFVFCFFLSFLHCIISSHGTKYENEISQEKEKNQVFLLALSSRYPIFLPRDQHCHYALTDWLSQVNCIFSKFFCQAHLLTVLNYITRPGSE